MQKTQDNNPLISRLGPITWTNQSECFITGPISASWKYSPGEVQLLLNHQVMYDTSAIVFYDHDGRKSGLKQSFKIGLSSMRPIILAKLQGWLSTCEALIFFCLINKIEEPEIARGQPFFRSWFFELSKRKNCYFYVCQCWYCFTICFVVLFLFLPQKAGDKFKTYSGITLSLLCCSQGKFKLRLNNEFFLALIWIQTTYIARYSVVKLITLIKLFRNKPISKSNHLSAYFNQKPEQIEFNEIVHNFANQFL